MSVLWADNNGHNQEEPMVKELSGHDVVTFIRKTQNTKVVAGHDNTAFLQPEPPEDHAKQRPDNYLLDEREEDTPEVGMGLGLKICIPFWVCLIAAILWWCR